MWKGNGVPAFLVSVVFSCVPSGLLRLPPATGTRVDSIWTARYVVTMDPVHRIIRNGAVAISGDHIVEAEAREEIDRKYAG